MLKSKSIDKLKKSFASRKGHLTRKLQSGKLSPGSYRAFLGHLTRELNNAINSRQTSKLPKQAKKQGSGRGTEKKRKIAKGKSTPVGKTNKDRGKRQGTKRKTKQVSRSIREKRRRSATKGASTKRLDKLGVNRIEGGKTPFKGINFITFESTEFTKEILNEVIKRANIETDKPLMKVTVNGIEKDTKDETHYSTIVFPVYLESFDNEVKKTKHAEIPDDTSMIDTILQEVETMSEYYNIEPTSYEFFIFW